MENILLTQLSVNELKKLFRDEIENYFQTNPLKKSDEDERGGIELAIEITGLKKPTIYGLVSKRKIPHSKPEKRLYFSRKDLLAWIEKGKRKTADEIAAKPDRFNSRRRY